MVDAVQAFTTSGVSLKSGASLDADIIVLAAGCKYIARPSFLKDVQTGMKH